jgi:mannosyltransferase
VTDGNHRLFKRVIGLLLVIAATLPALLTMRESLWVDELHTSWVVLAKWTQVAGRATEGNQSPVYFWLLRAFLTLFPVNEVTLRLPSILAWAMMIYGCARLISNWLPNTVEASNTERQRRWIGISVVAIWLVFDRIGIFYAIEARPYALVALCSLVMIHRSSHSQKFANSLDLVWSVAAMAACYLHYTAVLVVMASWAGRVVVSVFTSPWDSTSSNRIQSPLRVESWQKISVAFRLGEIVFVLLGTVPALYGMATVMQKSQMWAIFAADTTIQHSLEMLPLLPWCVIPLLITFLVVHRRENSSFQQHFVRSENAGVLIPLLSVAIIPLVVAWAVTALNIAPLMHRRYVIGSYPAILLLGAWSLLSLVSIRQVLLLGVLSTSVLIFQQGTDCVWRTGQLFGWQRGEDWSTAIVELNRKAEAEDHLILAPRLIETANLAASQTKSAEYLQYPIDGLYSCKIRYRSVLLNDHPLAELITLPGRYWLLARVSPEKLKSIVEVVVNSPNKNPTQMVSQTNYGNLQLAEILVLP